MQEDACSLFERAFFLGDVIVASRLKFSRTILGGICTRRYVCMYVCTRRKGRRRPEIEVSRGGLDDAPLRARQCPLSAAACSSSSVSPLSFFRLASLLSAVCLTDLLSLVGRKEVGR
jgi:hypothetical protein